MLSSDVILFVNGAFGIGKTTVARLLVKRLPKAVLFDPEPIGIALQRIARVDDFQDLRAWRRLTIAGLRVARWLRPNVVVPMAFSNLEYLNEIRNAASRFDDRVLHVCLVAPLEIVQNRLRQRGAEEWCFRRAGECCVAHESARFAPHVNADRAALDIAEDLRNLVTSQPRNR